MMDVFSTGGAVFAEISSETIELIPNIVVNPRFEEEGAHSSKTGRGGV